MKILRAFLLLLSLIDISQSAFAEDYFWFWNNAPEIRGADPESVGAVGYASDPFPSPWSFDGCDFSAVNQYRCYVKNPQTGSRTFVGAVNRGGTVCPAETVLNPATGICEGLPPCESGNKQQFAVTSDHLPASVCKDLCTWTESGTTAVQVEGVWYSSYTSTSARCQTNTPLLPSEPKQCPKGTHNISNDFNNLNCTADDPTPPSCWAGSTNISTDPSIAICIDNSPPKPEEPLPQGPPTKKTDITGQKNPDGTTTTTTTETTTQKMSDGTTTITKKITQITTNLDGTTTTKVTDAGAQSGGGGGNSDGLCRDNPNLTICRESSVGNGNCSPEGIDSTTCDGDPITCAMLKQQKKEYCEDHKADPIRTLGEQILGGNDPKKDTFPTIENAREVPFPTTLDQNGFLGGGACFSDFQFSVSNRSFTIPFSKLCDYLIALRGLVMLLATLASWRLISKSVLG